MEITLCLSSMWGEDTECQGKESTNLKIFTIFQAVGFSLSHQLGNAICFNKRIKSKRKARITNTIL